MLFFQTNTKNVEMFKHWIICTRIISEFIQIIELKLHISLIDGKLIKDLIWKLIPAWHTFGLTVSQPLVIDT